jgi:hypothetical protein
MHRWMAVLSCAAALFALAGVAARLARRVGGDVVAPAPSAMDPGPSATEWPPARVGGDPVADVPDSRPWLGLPHDPAAAIRAAAEEGTARAIRGAALQGDAAVARALAAALRPGARAALRRALDAEPDPHARRALAAALDGDPGP